MRLIDADGLKPLRGVAIYATDEKTDTKIITASVYRREEIDKAPTVDAIPIDWIKLYASYKATRDGMDCYWSMWEEDIHGMIKDWEEECEKQQSTTSE